MPKQVGHSWVISIDGQIQRGAAFADGVYVGPAKQQFFGGGQLIIKDGFGQGRVAELFSGVRVRALVQQIANDVEAAFAGGEKQRLATVAG